jgi:3-dehydroquinate synthase
MMEEVKVNLGERSYSILVGQELIAEAGSIFRERGINGKILVITNPTVGQWYLKPLLNSLAASDFEVNSVEIPDGEEHKSLEQANCLYNVLVEGRYDRKTVLIALGGGVVGDLTGFVASTYMRGVQFVQIPTTLLAQVDSSIGGKVAVNHPQGKNLIGAFYQPGLVISDVDALVTLPEVELSSGMAEVVKHGLILDENYFQLIMGEIGAIRRVDPGIMAWVVTGSCDIKARVVEEDEKESGLRAVLNFGHTLGHALESITEYKYYKHGQAISLGMLAAVQIADAVGLLEQQDLYETLLKIFKELDLPTVIPGFPVADIFRVIHLDKKVELGKIRWVLPKRVGEVTISGEVPQGVVEKILLGMGARA